MAILAILIIGGFALAGIGYLADRDSVMLIGLGMATIGAMSLYP